MRTRRWLDPRLLIGVALVAISVASVAFIMTAANRTTEVWAVSAAVVPGDVLEADDVMLSRVQLEQAADRYHEQSRSPIGMVVTKPMEAGELIPVSAVAEAAAAALSRVVVSVEGPLPAGAERGAGVDVWASVELDRDEMSEPTVLVDDAIVAAVHTSEGLMVASSGVQVELLVPAESTAALLHAIASGHVLHLVPDPTPGAQP